MSYNNVPKNLTKKAVLTREGRPDYFTLSAAPFPVPTADERGAILEHIDTGDRYRWTSTTWIKVGQEGAVRVIDVSTFYLEVAAGRVPGKAVVHIFGRNPSISTADGFEDLWNGGGKYTGFDAVAAEQISVVSSSANDTLLGTGARTLLIEGLDANLVEQTELIELDGLTPVLTVGSYLRCSVASVKSAGSLEHNEGELTGNQNVTVANVFFVMPIETNRTMIAVYTVPANKTMYINNGFVTLATKKVTSSEIKAQGRLPGEVFQVVEWFSLSSTGSSYVSREFEIPFLALPAGTDFKLSGDSDNASGAGLAGGFEAILEDV